MNVVGKKPWIVNVLSFAMAVCISVTSLLSSGLNTKTIVVSADTSAKSRVQTFIGLAAGKSGNALPDIGQLTQDELQFLGVYLSNFYVPFSTELGISGQNDQLDEQKALMVEALNANLNFNETVSSELVDNIMGLSRSNNRELYYGFTRNANALVSGSVYKCSYWDFVNFMFGSYDPKVDFSSDVHVDTDPGRVLLEGNNASEALYGVVNDVRDGLSTKKVLSSNIFGEDKKEFVKFLYQNDDGSYTEVGSAHLNGAVKSDEGKTYTAFQIAFFQCLLSVNTDKGYGLNFFDITRDDKLSSGKDVVDDLYDLVISSSSDMSEGDIYSMTAYGSTMSVDCFGNIIRYGSNPQINSNTWMHESVYMGSSR